MKHDDFQYCIRGVLLLCLLTFGLPVAVWASEPPASERDARSGQVVTIEDVVVREQFEPMGMESTGTTVLSNDQIVDRVYVTPMDMLTLSPGISIVQYRQGGVVPGVRMRGFSSVGHSRDGAISLNGVPLNTLDNADVNVIIPMEVERIEVTKGPSSPFHGNFNSAGSIAFKTFQSGDFTRGKLSYGSFNTQDAVVVIARSDGKLDQVYAGEVFHTDGYQDNSDWDKQIAAGRWNYRFTDRLQSGMGVRYFNSRWDAPGYIPESVYRSNPEQAVSEVNGGWRKWLLVDNQTSFALTNSSRFRLLTWYTDEDWNRWHQNWLSEAQTPGSNYGTVYHRPREAFGANLAYHYKGQVLDRDTGLVIGASWQRDRQRYEYWNLVVGQGRIKGDKTIDDDLTLYTTGFFGELDYRLFAPLRIVLGGRFDIFRGSRESRLNSDLTADRNGPEIFSPKVGLIFSPIERAELFANYSKGFALPGGLDFVGRSYLDPAIRTQYEAGLRVNPWDWVGFIFSAWRLDTTDDFQPSLSDPNIFENAGETRRQGLEAAMDIQPWHFLSLHLNYAYIDSEYRNFYSGGVQYAGNTLSNVPQNLFNAEIAWAPPQGLGGRLSYRYQSGWYVAADNLAKADDFDVVNAQISYKFNRRYTLAVDVINLFDRKYSEYLGTANGQLTYAPADPFSAFVSLTIDW